MLQQASRHKPQVLSVTLKVDGVPNLACFRPSDAISDDFKTCQNIQNIQNSGQPFWFSPPVRTSSGTPVAQGGNGYEM